MTTLHLWNIADVKTLHKRACDCWSEDERYLYRATVVSIMVAMLENAVHGRLHPNATHDAGASAVPLPFVTVGTGTGPPGESGKRAVKTSIPSSVTSSVCSVGGVSL